MLDEKKLRESFPNTTVFKDQNLIATFKSASIPAFLRDWILKKKAGADGKINDKDELRRYMNAIIPRREDLLALKDAARTSGASKKFLARIDIRFNVASNQVSFEIPDLGISHAETLVEDYVWNRIKDEVVSTSGGWG